MQSDCINVLETLIVNILQTVYTRRKKKPLGVTIVILPLFYDMHVNRGCGLDHIDP